MATFDYNRTNLGAATLSSSITAAATTATVGASDAATFPTAPFYATIMPVGETPNQLNSEIVQVTANNSGALGLVRAQRGTTAKAFDAGALVMNGVYIQDLEQAQAVGKSFFSATLTSGVYYINDSRVPTTTADGDSIRVVFGSNWTSGTPQLSLNNGTAANIYAGNNLTSGNASTTTNAMVKSGVIYELTYYNGNWYVLNLVANNSITSDNIDWDDMGHVWRKTYDVTIAAASGTVNYDVPIDIVNNRRVEVYMSYESSSGSIAWSRARVLNGSKSVINCYQTGIECAGGATRGAFVNRGDFDQIIAWGNEEYTPAHAEIFLKRAATGNYVTFTANGFGGGNVDNRRSQMFQGRIGTSSANVKYIRFKVINPQANGSIVVMSLR